MPRSAVDYSKTQIYKIVSKDLSFDYCYVGSTTDFTRRKYAHKKSCKEMKNKAKLYAIINENGGWEQFDMVLIEKYECKDGNEANMRERYWFEILNSNKKGILSPQ